MTQENRVWIASGLSALVLVVYVRVLGQRLSSSRPTPQPQNQQALVQQEPFPQLESNEEVITLESATLRLEIGKNSAAVHSLVLKQFHDIEAKTPLEFGKDYPVLLVDFGADRKRPCALVEQSSLIAAWQCQGDLVNLRFVLELNQELPIFTLGLNATNLSDEPKIVPIRVVAAWGRSDEVSGRYNLLEAVLRTEKTNPWQRTYLHYLEGATQPRSVPRGTFLITLAERYFCQAMRPELKSQISVLPAKRGTIALAIDSPLAIEPNGTTASSIRIYAGPRDFFHLRDAGFEQAFSLGFLSRIGLILLMILKGIASVVQNYGVAIVLLAGLVTVGLSPFTMMSFRSMKKMQELQPKIEQIRKKYERDSQRVNKEVFALFREHRVSPLSGCLPMLLQLPVFFALWSAISHVIEFRGERFLWIKDLSLPDRLAKLPAGLDLNFLPILMAIAMYAQTKMSQLSQRNVTDPTQKLLSGPMMSIVFGVMFYQVPSCLVLYWLTNSLVSLLWYKLALREK